MKYPILLLAGRDEKRRELLKVLDPDEKYKSKVALPFLGKTVIEWVVEAFLKSKYVEDVYILGLTEEDVKINGPVHFIPCDPYSRISQKYKAGLDYIIEAGKPHEELIICSGDCPGIQVEAIDKFIEKVQQRKGYDFVIGGVPEEVLKEVIPEHKRAVGRFRDVNILQGEIASFSPMAINELQDVIDNFTEPELREKKSFWRTLWLVAKRPSSWSKILKIVLKRGTLEDAATALSRAFKIKADCVVIEDPGLAMDMDLPEDYDKIRRYVAKINNIEINEKEL
ncbi:MAG: NTP transferase domain-containing protein [Candidatus Heimdallarchaeota archaeon]|nr:NTP transferase domain-containing protein [Candidatus Heimdallarchaeota archaeon]MCK4877639.1 NTP transferase domain-containing protein [Candidatus Heimdallarchaeota archaeon]